MARCTTRAPVGLTAQARARAGVRGSMAPVREGWAHRGRVHLAAQHEVAGTSPIPPYISPHLPTSHRGRVHLAAQHEVEVAAQHGAPAQPSARRMGGCGSGPFERPRQRLRAQRAGLSLGALSCPEPPGAYCEGAGAEAAARRQTALRPCCCAAGAPAATTPLPSLCPGTARWSCGRARPTRTPPCCVGTGQTSGRTPEWRSRRHAARPTPTARSPARPGP